MSERTRRPTVFRFDDPAVVAAVPVVVPAAEPAVPPEPKSRVPWAMMFWIGVFGLAVLATGLADGLNSPSVGALTQRFAGPLATGRWMGTQNAISNTAGILAPAVTGYLVQRNGGHYTLALWVTGGVALLGLLAWFVVVPVVEPVDWRPRGISAPAPGP